MSNMNNNLNNIKEETFKNGNKDKATYTTAQNYSNKSLNKPHQALNSNLGSNINSNELLNHQNYQKDNLTLKSNTCKNILSSNNTKNNHKNVTIDAQLNFVKENKLISHNNLNQNPKCNNNVTNNNPIENTIQRESNDQLSNKYDKLYHVSNFPEKNFNPNTTRNGEISNFNIDYEQNKNGDLQKKLFNKSKHPDKTMIQNTNNNRNLILDNNQNILIDTHKLKYPSGNITSINHSKDLQNTQKLLSNISSMNKSHFNSKNKNSFLNNNVIDNKSHNIHLKNNPTVLKSSFIAGCFEKTYKHNKNQISLQQNTFEDATIFLNKDKFQDPKLNENLNYNKEINEKNINNLHDNNEFKRNFSINLNSGKPKIMNKNYQPVKSINYTNVEGHTSDLNFKEVEKLKKNNKSRSNSFHILKYGSSNSKHIAKKGSSQLNKDLNIKSEITNDLKLLYTLKEKKSIDHINMNNKFKDEKQTSSLLQIKKQYDEAIKKKKLPISFIIQSKLIN